MTKMLLNIFLNAQVLQPEEPSLGWGAGNPSLEPPSLVKEK